jgi:hypothetical protein
MLRVLVPLLRPVGVREVDALRHVTLETGEKSGARGRVVSEGRIRRACRGRPRRSHAEQQRQHDRQCNGGAYVTAEDAQL